MFNQPMFMLNPAEDGIFDVLYYPPSLGVEYSDFENELRLDRCVEMQAKVRYKDQVFVTVIVKQILFPGADEYWLRQRDLENAIPA
jgi:hypothetical protein